MTSARSDALGRFESSTLHGLLFLSGALALVYEVLWLRKFTTVFGATTPAAATLAAVFVGLTAGSAFLGSRMTRVRRPLRMYGLLEIGAGLSALLVEPLLMAFDRGLPALHEHLDGAPFLMGASRVLLTMTALFVPSFLMGGTVPAVAQAVSMRTTKPGAMSSGLYAANTFGAALGALSVPFFWLPMLGTQGSYAFCVLCSVLVGLAAWLMESRRPPARFVEPEAQERLRDPIGGTASAELPVKGIAALAALSGGLMFILQVTWTRMFSQVHENSIYSFAVVVAVFILGLAGGAALARVVLLRSGRVAWFIGWAWIAGGLAVFATPHVFLKLTDGLSYLPGQAGWMSYGAHLVWLSAATVFVPTMLGGGVLPLLMELAIRTRQKSTGQALGWLLAVNTAGVVAGSFFAAFVLPKLMGLWVTISVVGLLMIVVGELSFGGLAGLGPRRLVVGGLVILCAVVWNPAQLPRTKVRASQGDTLVDLREGNHGIVAVVDRSGSRRLKLDNFYVLGGTGSMGDERMQAHIPLILHPAPKTVAFLGLGTGITAGAALLHPIERVTAIEMVPEAVDAAKTHFTAANLGIATSTRADVVIEDARTLLRTTGKRFDVIVGDLVVPWRRGESALYTYEHFNSVRRALAPGGIFCQWLPLFQLSEDEFRIVAATFLDVFPMTTLWRGDFAPDQPALAFVGSGDGAGIDPAEIERRVRELTPDAANSHLIDPAGLWVFYVGALNPKSSMFTDVKRNHENRPWLEILSPLAHAGETRDGPRVFVGRELEKFLSKIRAEPLKGFHTVKLQPQQLEWRDAGAQMSEASLLVAEGKSASADELLRAAVNRLPLEVRRAFAPEPDGRQP